MVHHHRTMIIPHLLLRKPDVENQNPHLQPLVYSNLWSTTRKSKLTLLRLLFLFSLLSCSLLFAPRLSRLLPPSDQPLEAQLSTAAAPCSPMANDTICCDRTAFRTDLCFMRGDIRTNSATNSLFLLSNANSTAEEKIRPYTRKWETSVMATIDELTLSTVTDNLTASCDVRHDVPAVVFSTGGYTGNVYHEFNDGLIPLYITSRHFNKQVVFVLLEYHDWWITKYGNVISLLSDYPAIDFSGDKRTHCFPEATVGLKIHDELTIDASKMTDRRTIADFRRMLDEAYKPRIQWINQEEENKTTSIGAATTKKPKLVIVSRNGSRAIENEDELASLAAEIGFRVEVLRPERTTELARIYKAMNSSDAMVGVHGAAMTHFLFMRPGSVFIQIVPLGTDWAAETYYGEPAVKLGLKYMRYGILAKESSLYREYEKSDPVLRDPESVNAKGWETTKKVYLDGQKVRLDLRRFRKRLVRAHQYLVAKIGGKRREQ